jgi:alpha-galactosidase
MGWNSWNTFGGNISEELIRETAQAMVDLGFRNLGYQYLVIDDFWEADERDKDGRLQADADKFPSGIRPLADFVHSLGLKFGIYSCAGTHTCGRRLGSYANEEIDAQTFADWEVDYLKYDYCYKPEGVSGPMLYRRMGQALRQTGRPIVYSLCNWGREEPWKWAASCGAHLWRTTDDILDSWESVKKIGFRQNGLECYAGPNHWNDPDMLVVGMYGKGNDPVHIGCTDEEYRTHFGLWCLLAAPLMMGCDVRNLTQTAREILSNPELLAVNQDPLGRQGFRLGETWLHGDVWAKPLSDGSWAVGLFNLHDSERYLISVAFETLGIHDRQVCAVRDLWAREDAGEFRGSYSACVEPHGCVMLRVIPQVG